jgi:DNA repair protein SbcC/Rad50
MIISRVQITNYKQYAGDHDITIPSAATIGVIGANGVGKTTLFEAIEWALYGTGVASTKDIRPRGRAGNTQVNVTLDLPASGEQYIVERELRKSSTRAVVYKIEPDGEEAIIVQGAGPVTTYVQDTLIGLDHKAFTATFFTRQKELSFFGDLGESARRREVGKLLGLETIRLAQQKIGEDRTRARNEATVLEKQYENQSKGHDFPAEIAAAEETIRTSKESLATAHKDVNAATGRVTSLEKDYGAHQELKDRDGAAATKILELRGQLHHATHQRDNATTELQCLDDRAKERETLAQTASALESLQQQMAELDQQRERFQRRQQLHHAIIASEKRRGDVLSSLRSTVLGITPPSPIEGWTWGNGDSDDPVKAASRYIAVLDRVDVSAEERREGAYQRLREMAKERQDALETLRKYEETRKRLEEMLSAQLLQGHPAPELEAAQTRMLELQKQDATLAAEHAQIAPQQQKITRLATNLRNADMNEPCPTCGRPFSRDDVADTLAIFQQQIEALQQQASGIEQQRAAIDRERTALQKTCSELEKRASDIDKTRQRIDASVPYITDQTAKVEALERKLKEQLQAVGRTSLPDDDEVTRVSVEVRSWRRMIDARGHITKCHGDILTIDAEIAPLRSDFDAIGEVAYDEADHRKVTADHQEAIKAATTVAQIDRELARRPQIETDLATATKAVADLTAQINAAENERAAIGFDPAKLESVLADLRKAREERETAVEMRHRIQNGLTSAEHALESLVKERDRIAGLATQAEEQRHLHDRLDQMYREFDEFDRYAAAWYAPKLSEITSELVAEVTDGKYDRVVFDNNFGIDIYDGDEEKFPLDTFSGGERDAIALCARIALSRVIGGTGSQPPGFLVLDEVFGSLDLDRRQRLLEMLGAITGSGEHFRQVFIISHVDDVRTSPIFDELWQVVENTEGTSELQTLGHGTDIGEL